MPSMAASLVLLWAGLLQLFAALIAVSVVVRLIRVCWPQRAVVVATDASDKAESGYGALLHAAVADAYVNGASSHSLQPKQEDALDSAVPAEDATSRVMGRYRRLVAASLVAGAVAGGGVAYFAPHGRGATVSSDASDMRALDRSAPRKFDRRSNSIVFWDSAEKLQRSSLRGACVLTS